MAKNYTFAEAAQIIAAGKDFEAMQDIGHRFPIMAQKVAKITALAGSDFTDLMGFMPDYLTANKVNTAIKSGIGGETSEDDSDDSDEDTNEDAGEAKTAKTATTKATAKASNDSEKDYESMSSKQLWEILGKAGKRKLAKSTKKEDLVAACKAMDTETSDEADDEEEEKTSYESKSAMELFKECKKRGIVAEPKKPVKFYADLLTKADAKAAKTAKKDEAEDDEDWDDSEAETETKTEATKAAKTTKTAKTEKKDDGDDDWDI